MVLRNLVVTSIVSTSTIEVSSASIVSTATSSVNSVTNENDIHDDGDDSARQSEVSTNLYTDLSLPKARAPTRTLTQRKLGIGYIEVTQTRSVAEYVNSYPNDYTLEWNPGGLLLPSTTGLNRAFCLTTHQGVLDPRTELYVEKPDKDTGKPNGELMFLPRVEYLYPDSNTTVSTRSYKQFCEESSLDLSVTIYEETYAKFGGQKIEQIKSSETVLYQFYIPGGIWTKEGPKFKFHLKNVANPRTRMQDNAAKRWSFTISSGIFAATGEKPMNAIDSATGETLSPTVNSKTRASMEVLRFSITPNLYNSPSELEVILRIRGLQKHATQGKRILMNTWIVVESPTAHHFDNADEVYIHKRPVNVLSDDQYLRIGVTDCQQIGKTCTGNYLGFQFGDTYVYNTDWEKDLRDIFANDAFIDSSKFNSSDAAPSFVGSGATTINEDNLLNHYVLPSNPSVVYANDTVPGSISLQDSSNWSQIASSTRYSGRVSLDPATGLPVSSKQYEADDVIILKFRIAGWKSPSFYIGDSGSGNGQNKDAAGVASGGDFGSNGFWTIRLAGLSSREDQYSIGVVRVKPSNPMRIPISVTFGFLGFYNGLLMSAAPGAFLHISIDINSAKGGLERAFRYFYLYSGGSSTSDSDTWNWNECNFNPGVQKNFVRCYAVPTTVSSGSVVQTISKNWFNVFGEIAIADSGEVFSLFVKAPASKTPITKNWILVLDVSQSNYNNIVAKVVNDLGSRQLEDPITMKNKLASILDYNLQYVRGTHYSGEITPPAISQFTFTIRAVPAVIDSELTVDLDFFLRSKGDFLGLSGLRITGSCEILGYSDAFTGQASIVQDGGATVSTSTVSDTIDVFNTTIQTRVSATIQTTLYSITIPISRVKVSGSDGQATAKLHVKACDNTVVTSSNAIPGVNKPWLMEVRGGTRILDSGTSPHFPVADTVWNPASAINSVATDLINFKIALPNVSSGTAASGATGSGATPDFSIRIVGINYVSCGLLEIPGAELNYPNLATGGTNQEKLECGVGDGRRELSLLAKEIQRRRNPQFTGRNLQSTAAGLNSAFPASKATGFQNPNSVKWLAITNIPTTRTTPLEFQILSQLPLVEQGVVEVFEFTGVTAVAGGIYKRRSHTVLQGNVGLASQKIYSQCGSEVSILLNGNSASYDADFARLTAYSPAAATGLTAADAIGKYKNLKNEENGRIQIKRMNRGTTTSTSSASSTGYVLQDTQTGVQFLWTPLEPTDNYWFLGSERVGTTTTSCSSKIEEREELYGDLDTSEQDAKDRETLNTIVTTIIVSILVCTSLTCVYYITQYRDECLARLKIVLLMRYNVNKTGRFYDYYAGELGGQMGVEFTYPSYWEISHRGKSELAAIAEGRVDSYGRKDPFQDSEDGFSGMTPHAERFSRSTLGANILDEPNCQMHICPPHVVAGVQRMLDETWRLANTRDRKRLAARIGGTSSMPKRLEVKYVARVENKALWAKYAQLRSNLFELSHADMKIEPWRPVPISTTTWCDRELGLPHPELFASVNEFIFFHGTSPSAADAIANEGFKLSFAGTFGGSMYGRGIYLCEACTKGDEYSREETLDVDGEAYCAMLVVRALAARVYYTDAIKPDGQHIENLCRFNKFDSVLGDREKARDTYKEWVLFKPEQTYVEYVIRYKRCFDHGPPVYQKTVPKKLREQGFEFRPPPTPNGGFYTNFRRDSSGNFDESFNMSGRMAHSRVGKFASTQSPSHHHDSSPSPSSGSKAGSRSGSNTRKNVSRNQVSPSTLGNTGSRPSVGGNGAGGRDTPSKSSNVDHLKRKDGGIDRRGSGIDANGNPIAMRIATDSPNSRKSETRKSDVRRRSSQYEDKKQFDLNNTITSMPSQTDTPMSQTGMSQTGKFSNTGGFSNTAGTKGSGATKESNTGNEVAAERGGKKRTTKTPKHGKNLSVEAVSEVEVSDVSSVGGGANGGPGTAKNSKKKRSS